MSADKQEDELRCYRKFGVTLLQLMAVLAVAGILTTVLFNYFF
jgi:Tfp pilus assembly protein PilE